MTEAEAVAALEKSVGPGGWVPAEDRQRYAADMVAQGAAPLAVLRPTSTEEVARILSICHAAGLAVVPQSGNTNACHMAVPLEGQRAVVVALTRMAQVLDVDAASGTLTVEAGCPMQVAQDAAAAAGKLFAPDWGARGTATVGGAVATNGGGLNVLRYGTTREQVLGLEVVLPDGQIWDGLRALRKDNAGYDLKQLFIGSEGTLGIITKLVFRLHPAQPVSQSILVAPRALDALMPMLALAHQIGGGRLSAFELIPGLGLDLALARYPALQRPLPQGPDWVLLIRFSAAEPVTDDLVTLFEQAEAEGLIDDGVLAESEAQERNLWELRDQQIPGQYFDRPWLKWDVSVPLSRLPDFLRTAPTLIAETSPEAAVHMTGHVGDGNIHLSVFPPVAQGSDLDTLTDTLYPKVDAFIWSLGGSIVAEHGVGAVYRARMRRQKSPLEYALLQRLKHSFDPMGRMNPGKLLFP